MRLAPLLAAALFAAPARAVEPDASNEAEAADAADAPATPEAPPPGAADDAPGGPPADAREPEVVVVTGSRTPERRDDSVTAVQIIDRARIEASGADTLAQLLELVGGVHVFQSFTGQGVQLSGYAPEHTLLMVDGQRIAGQVGGVTDLDRFDPDTIERIEIVRGPSSALYGSDALGGVIHIITRGASQPVQGQLSVTSGGYVSDLADDGRTPFGPAQGAATGLDHVGIDASVGLRRARTDVRVNGSFLGFDPAVLPDGAATTTRGLRQVDGGVRLRQELGTTVLRGDVRALSRTTDAVSASATGAVLDATQRTETVDLTLGAEGPVSRKLTLTGSAHLGLFRDQLLQDQRGGDQLDTFQLTRNLLGEVNLQLAAALHKRHSLTAGVDVLLEDLVADRLVDGRAGRQRGALFVQHAARWLDATRLSTTLGLRLDVDSLFGVFPAPRVAVRVDPHDAVTVRLGGGLGFRAPDVRQLYLFFDNPSANYRVEGLPELRPERSVGGTADVDVRAHRLFTLSLSGWASLLQDLIQPSLEVAAAPGTPSVFRYDNVGRARIAGASATATAGAGEPVSGSLSYTFVHTRDLDAGVPLDGRPAHQVAATLRGDHAPTGLGAMVSTAWLSERGFGLAGENPVFAAGYVQLDARVRWRIRDVAEVFVGIDNALDAGDRAIDPLRPRRVYAGVSGAFPKVGG